MGLTNFPNGIFATPNLGGQLPPLLCMQTDAKSIFVDGARPVSGSGQSPADAFNTIQAAITAAKQFDVIYVITKPISASGTGVTGKYTEILTVLKAQQMLTIVGVGPNTTGGRPLRQCGIYGTANIASPVLTAGAECLGLENLKINMQTSNTYGVYAGYTGDTTTYGNNLSAYNCHFVTTATGTAIYCHGVLGLTARNNDFQNCFIGINATSWVGTSFEILIEGNRFTIDSSAAGTPISADIIADTAGTSNIIVNNNLFAHLLPAGGVNLYGTIANARHGLVCNNIFGHSATLTVGAGGTAFVCPANVGSANNYCHGALMLYQ